LKRHSKEYITEQTKISAAADGDKEEDGGGEGDKHAPAQPSQEPPVRTDLPGPEDVPPGCTASEAKSSLEAEEVVEEVIENAEEEKGEIPNTTEASEPSVMEKYQQAFNLEQFEIKY
jgi:hypothetical protein